MIRIIDKRINNVVVFNYIKNDFYELIDYYFNKAFISINRTIIIIMKVLFKRKHFIFIIFELIH